MPSHKCPKCGQKFNGAESAKRPRALQCGHSFCSQCLSGLGQIHKKKKRKGTCLSFPARSRERAAATSSRAIRCPTCNHSSCYVSKDPEPCVNFALMNCEFSCQVCAQLFGTAEHRPVIFACGHSVCHSCSIGCIQFRCPSCRLSSHTMPNTFVRDLIAAGFCEHGRQKSQCKDCKGSGICEHGRRKSRCKNCKGNGIARGSSLCRCGSDDVSMFANDALNSLSPQRVV